ncbi:hypothetical protein BT63DRAFT_112458 [Microthyrium microscopicum]|uniref:RBR-type E3 ubiquitin transferase n=1 Tax=Microthyrium microscopicum TaxID=703497 RepID=A0A6A6TXV3_9PEZI|nr:hypothetical protein BT63DRAFT_112458 [Microthyrium microscopicum]
MNRPPQDNPLPANGGVNDELVALTLQLEDVGAQVSYGMRQAREGAPPSDSLLALLSFQNELQQRVQVLDDKQYACGLAGAEHPRGNVSGVAIVVQEPFREGRAVQEPDRVVNAPGEQNGEANPAPLILPAEVEDGPVHAQPKEQGDLGKRKTAQQDIELILHRVAKRLFTFDVDESESGLDPSTNCEKRHKQDDNNIPEYQLPCIACMEQSSPEDMLIVPCDHIYCKNCLKELFLSSAKDESLFHPKCCGQDIPLRFISPAMTPNERQMFHNAQVEFTTVNRTYCSKSSCGTFVPPAHIGEDGFACCGDCQTKTCVHCKKPSHDGVCQADQELLATLALAKELGWQRCPSCNTMVELNVGCYHITCKCNYHFCYRCAVEWKKCECPVWEEAQLLARAEEVVAREAVHPLQPEEQQVRVVEMRQELIDQHECNHPGKFERINRVDGPRFVCEICDCRPKKWVLRCRRCHIQVCLECRLHRVHDHADH